MILKDEKTFWGQVFEIYIIHMANGSCYPTFGHDESIAKILKQTEQIEGTPIP